MPTYGKWEMGFNSVFKGLRKLTQSLEEKEEELLEIEEQVYTYVRYDKCYRLLRPI